MSAETTRGVCRRCAGLAWLPLRIFEPFGLRQTGPQRVCRHHCVYPPRLRADPLAPPAIEVHGSAERLRESLKRGVVALTGPPSPSDYGLRCTETLAREVAAAGVSMACIEGPLGDAACAGAVRVNGATIALGDDSAGGRLASLSALALLADLVIVVEAGERASDLTAAEVARSRDIPIAVAPGPIDSPASRASNELIFEDVPVVCRAEHALDILGDVGARRTRQARTRRRSMPRATSNRRTGAQTTTTPAQRTAAERRAAGPHAAEPCVGGVSTTEPRPAELSAAESCAESKLEPQLAGVLDRVRHGQDTLAELCLGERDCDELAVALTELELLGLLRRGSDGRYLPFTEHLR